MFLRVVLVTHGVGEETEKRKNRTERYVVFRCRQKQEAKGSSCPSRVFPGSHLRSLGTRLGCYRLGS